MNILDIHLTYLKNGSFKNNENLHTLKTSDSNDRRKETKSTYSDETVEMTITLRQLRLKTTTC